MFVSDCHDIGDTCLKCLQGKQNLSSTITLNHYVSLNHMTVQYLFRLMKQLKTCITSTRARSGKRTLAHGNIDGL